MKNLIDLYPLIEDGFPDEIDQHAIKLVLLAEDVAQLESRFVTRNEFDLHCKDMTKLKLEMTIIFGGIATIAVGILATLIKVL